MTPSRRAAPLPGAVDGEELISGVSPGDLKPVYFIAGENEWLHQRVAAALLAAAVPEAWRGTDAETVWAAETGEGDAADIARTPPFGSPRRFLRIRVIEGYRSARRKGRKKATEGDSPLVAYMRSPAPSTVLVLSAEERQFREWAGDPLLVAAAECGMVVRCERLKGGQLAAWLASRARETGVNLGPGAADELIERTGDEPLRLESELEKLRAWAGGSGEVTARDVAEVSGMNAPPDVFQFLDILFVERSASRALSVLGRLLAEMHPLQLHALMLNQLRKLIMLRRAVQEGWPDGRIWDQLRIPYSIIQRLSLMVRRTSPARFAELLRAVAAAEASLKRGGNGRSVLEGLVLEVCQGVSLPR